MRYKREMLGFFNIYLDLEVFENIAMDYKNVMQQYH